MSEIVKSEYNALDEQGNYKKHYFKTSADQVVGLGRLKSFSYSVGDVVYSDTNNKVALKCTTSGTTSNTELDVSTKNIGDTVTDGSVVWQVCNRTSDVTSVNGKTGDVVVDTLPIGAIIPFAGNTVPTGFLACSGATVSRTTYSKLFSAIGTTYGSGNGSTTFSLPNMGTELISKITNSNIPIKGTGMALGITDGSSNLGLMNWGDDNLIARTGAYGASIGASGKTGTYNTGKTLGITTDSSKSGLRADMTATKTTVKFCIKY